VNTPIVSSGRSFLCAAAGSNDDGSAKKFIGMLKVHPNDLGAYFRDLGRLFQSDRGRGGDARKKIRAVVAVLGVLTPLACDALAHYRSALLGAASRW